jgi:hypothetical protein
MPAPVVINTAAVQYAQGKTECHCVETVTGVTGTTTVSFVVVIDSETLAEDWTDAQLEAAVAEKLNIPAADVAVASAPVGTLSVAAPDLEAA